MSRQLKDGSWEGEGIEGGELFFPNRLLARKPADIVSEVVFNHTVGFTYPNFKYSWTICALGMAAKELSEEGW